MRAVLKKVLYNTLVKAFGRKQLIDLLTDNKEKALLSFRNGGYLHDTGWINSVEKNKIVDAQNAPLPWVTYPFIRFIEGRLSAGMELFEFGSGNSTLFYSNRVKSIHSVEHDKQWFDKIHGALGANALLSFCELEYNGKYCRFAASTNQKYDMILVDGRDRANCCKQSIVALKKDGVLMLDDSERPAYSESIEHLISNGFKKIDFWGIAPTVNYLKCTSIFYRADNCLQL